MAAAELAKLLASYELDTLDFSVEVCRRAEV